MKRHMRRLIVAALAATLMLSIPVFADPPQGSQSTFCKTLIALPLPAVVQSVMQRLFDCDCPPNCSEV